MAHPSSGPSTGSQEMTIDPEPLRAQDTSETSSLNLRRCSFAVSRAAGSRAITEPSCPEDMPRADSTLPPPDCSPLGDSWAHDSHRILGHRSLLLTHEASSNPGIRVFG